MCADRCEFRTEVMGAERQLWRGDVFGSGSEDHVRAAVERTRFSAQPRLPIDEPLPLLRITFDLFECVLVAERHAVARRSCQE